jgi:hypothetical protein
MTQQVSCLLPASEEESELTFPKDFVEVPGVGDLLVGKGKDGAIRFFRVANRIHTYPDIPPPPDQDPNTPPTPIPGLGRLALQLVTPGTYSAWVRKNGSVPMPPVTVGV